MPWIALALVALVALLFVPWTVHLTFRRNGQPRVVARLTWGGLRLGTLGADGVGHKPPAAHPREHNTTRSKGKRGASRAHRRRMIALVRSKGFVASLVRLGKNLLRQLRPRHTNLYIQFGLGDPADTAQLWGALSPLVVLLMTTGSGAVTLAPDFARRGLALEGQTCVRIVPGMLLALVLGYLATPAPWRAVIRSVQT